MPGQTQRPRRFVPSGLSDATDGSDVFAGACSRLTNLIPMPNARGVFVPRPAMVPQATLPDWGGGPVGKMVSIGNVFYGFYPSAQFAGYDRPFRYDPVSGFAPISGMSVANLPATQPTAGDWQPPTIAQVAGRIVFTHPGFAGGTTVPQLALSVNAQTTSGSNLVRGPPSLPQNIVGCVVSGGSIPGGTTITAVAQNYVYTTGTGNTASTSITVASTAGLVPGMSLFGPGIASIVTTVSGGTVTVPNPPTQNFTSASLQFVGSSLTLSQNATGTGSTALNIASPAPGIKFGWLDISGFSTSLSANTASGGTNLSGDPTLIGIGIQPGMTVSGPGIVAGTTVQAIAQVNLQAFGQMAPQSQIFQLGNVVNLTAAIAPGQSVSGPNIPPNTTVLSYNNSNYQVTMSQASTNLSTAYGVTLNFSGTDIQLSQAASGNNTQQNYTITGGTPAAPLWGAGDLAVNPLIGNVPAVFVAQYGGRAWYGVNASDAAAVQASDAGTACIQTLISQTLEFVNGIPVTAAAGMPLSNQLGGIIQSLMVFQGDSLIQQITGDFSQNNIAVNALQTATGTLSPDAIASTPRGLLFPASDGIRLIGFDASITDPIGSEGQGLSLPFQTAVTPSRTHGAFNENTYRVTITWQPPPNAAAIWGAGSRVDEFWFHFSELGRAFAESRWSGPHPSILDAAAPWPAQASFIVAPQHARGQLYRSDPRPTVSTIYTELGQQLACDLKTLLLPDNPQQNAIEVIETTLWLAYSSAQGEVLAIVTDDLGQMLDQTYVWIGPFSVAAQRPIPWHQPLVFRQMSLELRAAAIAQLQIGAINIRDEVLNYQLPYPVPGEFVLGTSVLAGPGVLGA